MTAPSARYAVYYIPEEGTALARFGQWWLGRKPDCPDYGPLPQVGLDPLFQNRIVTDARLYGFHGTLKAPFRLADGTSPSQLAETMAVFAHRTPAFTVAPLRLDRLNGFLALRPSRPEPVLDRLAEGCVRAFDRFRAPPDDAERMRRRKAGLSPHQEELLELWGYPYVLDQFRFHMTLSGRLDEAERNRLAALLEPRVAAAVTEPFAVRSICLTVQPAPGQPFVRLERFALAAP